MANSQFFYVNSQFTFILFLFPSKNTIPFQFLTISFIKLFKNNLYIPLKAGEYINMKKKSISIIIFILIFIIFLNFSYLRSLSIMPLYSLYHKQNSIMKEKNFTIHIPGGTITKEKDWYPFVMTFHDKTISSSIGEEINLTILYNFGAFEKGRSLFYKKDSDYFNAFYGAYVIESKDNNRKYGFNEKGELIEKEIMKISSHDIETLVLKSIGCKNAKVTFHPISPPRKANYLSYKNWLVIDSNITSKSPLHHAKNFYPAYIQYGKPPKNYKGKDFLPTHLYGRMYCRYFEEYDVTILLYILGPNSEMVDKTDHEILSKTVIKK